MSLHGDYAIFLTLAVAVLAVLRPMVRRGHPRARVPWVLYVAMLCVLAVGWFLVDQAGKTARQRIESMFAALAPTYAAELVRENHAALSPELPSSDPRWAAIRAHVDQWLRLNPAIADIYTIRQLPDGRRIFILDTDTDTNHDGVISESEKGALPGEEFAEADRGLDLALAGTANFNPDIVHDRWGAWVGAWAPLEGKDGKVEAVVGVDFDAATWLSAIGRARFERILQIALLYGILLAAAVIIIHLRASLEDRIKSQERQAASEQRLRFTLDQMPFSVLEIDADGKIIAANPACESTFGYRVSELTRRMSYPDLFPARDRARLRESICEQWGSASTVRSESTNLREDGREIRCEWFARAILDRSGKATALLCVAHDITERRERERLALRSQRLEAIGTLAGGVAHDINNALSPVMVSLEMLRSKLPESDDLIDLIHHSAQRGAQMVRRLLTFARGGEGERAPVSVEHLFHEMEQLISRSFPKQIELHISTESPLPAVFGNGTELHQVLLNLALNARDAMPEGGRLSLKARTADLPADFAPDLSAGKFVVIEVTDTGTGMCPETLDRIFDPFFSTKSPDRGTGLGLSSALGIIRGHGGSIQVRSTLGRGSTFTLFLPASAGVETPAPKPAPLHTPVGHGEEILIVDDEALVRESQRAVLQHCGYRVFVASDGVEGLRVIDEQPGIRAVVSDLQMPGMDGLTFCQALRKQRPSLPILVASGHIEPDVALLLDSIGIPQRLSKPFTATDLAHAISALLQTSSSN